MSWSLNRGLFVFAAIALSPSLAFAADITVSSPANNATVTTSFQLTASSKTCSSQTTASMGYSFDSSSTTTTFKATSISSSVSTSGLAAGSHVLHVKGWGTSGSSCSLAVNLTVSTVKASPSPSPTATASGPTVPSDATVAANIDTNKSMPWEWNHDAGTPGSASGTTDLVSNFEGKSVAREYSMSYTSSGGEIYHVDYAKSTTVTHFVYDVNVYFENGTDIANLEMDMNQVMSNGKTVIYGFQCDGGSKTWDYTYMNSSGSHWTHSKAACSPASWSEKTWHHVQIAYHRDSSGNVTYDSVTLDGKTEDIGVTVASAEDLNWATGVLLTNFQIDGSGTKGSAVVYTSGMKVSYW